MKSQSIRGSGRSGQKSSEAEDTRPEGRQRLTKRAITGTDQASRLQLLQAVSDLMIDRGSVDITLIDVANQSGLNPALVKYYFGSKDGMLVELLVSRLEASITEMHHMLVMDISPLMKMKLHIRGMIKTYFRYPYISALVHLLSRNSANGKIIREKITNPLIEKQALLLDEGYAAGHYKKISPYIFYFLLVGTCDHLFFEQRALGIEFDIGRDTDNLSRLLEDTLVETILNGICVSR